MSCWDKQTNINTNKQQVVSMSTKKPEQDLLCSWAWGRNSARALCRGNAPPSRPPPAAPRCCSRLSWRASSCARTQTVYVRQDPEPQGGSRSQSLQLQNTAGTLTSQFRTAVLLLLKFQPLWSEIQSVCVKTDVKISRDARDKILKGLCALVKIFLLDS